MEVVVILVILVHPDCEIGDDERLDYEQDLNGAGNVSAGSIDVRARTISPELEALDFEYMQI